MLIAFCRFSDKILWVCVCEHLTLISHEDAYYCLVVGDNVVGDNEPIHSTWGVWFSKLVNGDKRTLYPLFCIHCFAECHPLSLCLHFSIFMSPFVYAGLSLKVSRSWPLPLGHGMYCNKWGVINDDALHMREQCVHQALLPLPVMDGPEIKTRVTTTTSIKPHNSIELGGALGHD